jgi:uncharacterized protein (DUF2252 family)
LLEETDMTTVTRRAAATRSASPTAVAQAEQMSRFERVARGKDARAVAPRGSHGDFTPQRSRDPVGLLLEQATSRVPELVPVRHGRMLVSPFTFFRGAALPMTADLAGTPVSGLRVQLCGDAHLSNFGAFASPERRLVFDINDFDETLPGPFEWDLKRLAASFSVAGRENGFDAKTRRPIAYSVARSYRTAMRQFAKQPLMEVWYAHLEIEEFVAALKTQIDPKRLKAVETMLAAARTHHSLQALSKLTTVVDGQARIISKPPMIVPIEEVFSNLQAEAIYELVRGVLDKYRRTLLSDRRHLLEQFRLVQVARKVVGVGSVGQRAWVVLMDGADGSEPLFLQAKEAQPSVLAAYCGRSRHRNQGERVVTGQRLMQAVSDIFLGWTHNLGADGTDRHYYVRQLRDWKFSVPIEQLRPKGMVIYARMCGWTLARAHARSGDRIALASYLGRADDFDQAIADFAEAYADQNERDYAAFQEAVKDGRAQAAEGV